MPSISSAADEGVVYVGELIPCASVTGAPALSQRPRMYVAPEPCWLATVAPPGIHVGLPTASTFQSPTAIKTAELIPVRAIDTVCVVKEAAAPLGPAEPRTTVTRPCHNLLGSDGVQVTTMVPPVASGAVDCRIRTCPLPVPLSVC